MISGESALKPTPELMGETPSLGRILSHQACHLWSRLTNTQYGLGQHIRRVQQTLVRAEWHRADLSASAAATTGFPSKATPESCVEVER